MSEPLLWKDVIDRKVKSADDEDLGRVQSVSGEFLQTKEGKVSSKHYYIPKYYVEGYDEDGHIRVSISEDEAKERFKTDKPQDVSLSAPGYIERKQAVMAAYPDFETGMPQYRSGGILAGQISDTSMEQKAIPWERIIDKRVKLADDDDIGKVKSISPDFIEVKEGTASKHSYYIPKYYVDGYDGDDVYLSSVIASKEDARSKFERQSPPTREELRTPEYLERMRGVDQRYPQFLHGVPWFAHEPPTEIPVDYSGTSYDIPWDKLIHKHVRATDKVDIGYVERIGEEFLVIHPGAGSSEHVYYIPKTYIRSYDGSQLWIDVASRLARTKFGSYENEPSREELRTLARDAPRYRSETGSAAQASTMTRGHSVLWKELKGREVRTSDSKNLGEIKEISGNYLRIEKGAVRKDNKFWIPKFMFDLYDVKHVWLSTTEEETLQYLKNSEPSSTDEYDRDFETFRSARPPGWEPEHIQGEGLRFEHGPY